MNWILQFLGTWLVNALTLSVVAAIIPGVHVKNFKGAMWGALALGFVSWAIAPTVLFLSLPFNIVTLGLTYLLIVGGLFMLAAALAPGFKVDGCLASIGGALLLGIMNSLLGWTFHLSGWW